MEGYSATRWMVCGDFINPTQPLAWQCASALERLGVTVLTANTEIRQPRVDQFIKKIGKSLAKPFGLKAALSERFVQQERATIEAQLRAQFDRFRPNVVLVIRGNHVEPTLLQAWRSAGAKVIGWWIKDLKNIDNFMRDQPFHDLNFCIHANMHQPGIHYLPAVAIDPSRYRPLPRCPKLFDVVFVGIHTLKRREYLRALTGWRLGIVGPGWRSRFEWRDRALFSAVQARTLHGEALNQFYNSGRVVVNINQWDAGEGSGVTLRLADVPASGACLVSEYSQGIEEMFVPGKEIVSFSSSDELRERVAFYLAHEPERLRVAEAGHARAMRLPTHQDRMRELLDVVRTGGEMVSRAPERRATTWGVRDLSPRYAV
ncbi:MAG: glycosyltransferase [Magnetococcales bacterium]|nr:glycosyltransferase [Magnetococcales bacterium]